MTATTTPHKSLLEALVALQAEAPTLPKDATNPHFKSKFTPLDTIVQTIGPLLAKHGLAWSTLPCLDADGRPALRYQLAHTSGEVLTDTMPLLLGKSDSQALGSALTYARRYSICAVLNLVSDDDDDGHAAVRKQSERPTDEVLATGEQQASIYTQADHHGIETATLANIVKAAAGAEPALWETNDDAAAWLEKALPRLPARLLAPIGELIAKEGKS